MQKKLLAALLALGLANCSGPVVSRVCPQVTEFSAIQQSAVEAEMLAPPNKPAIRYLLDRVAEERAYNRAVCQ